MNIQATTRTGHFAAASAAAAQDPRHVTLLIYEAGPGWNTAVPPDRQELAAHFAYVGKALADGRIQAYGLQSDAIRGFYLFNSSDPDAVEAFTQSDPGVSASILKAVEKLDWTLAIDALPPLQPSDVLQMLKYRQGPRWVAGKSLFEQDIAEHLKYVTAAAQSGLVVGGGPVSNGEGLYLLRTDNAEVAANFIARDPAVIAGIFSPVAVGWNILAMAPSKP